MSKLLTPKIHTSSSSTKTPTSLHPIHPAHTAKSGSYTTPTQDCQPHPLPLPQPEYAIPSSTRIPILITQITTIPVPIKKNQPQNFSKPTRFTRARSSRFGPLPLLTSLVGTPPGTYRDPPGSDGYHDDVGTPPLSIASDTRRSSPRTPHQCRALARVHRVCRIARPPRSTRGVTQLHIKGVLTLSFPQEIILTPTLRTAFRVNKATTPMMVEVIG